jgi:hypothetical protein
VRVKGEGERAAQPNAVVVNPNPLQQLALPNTNPINNSWSNHADWVIRSGAATRATVAFPIVYRHR